MTAVARRLGCELEVFAVPTGLFLIQRPGDGEAPLLSMARLSTWRTDRQLLTAQDELVNAVADGVESIPEARARIRWLTPNLNTWWFGIPSSSSYAPVDGLAGAVVGHAAGSAPDVGRRLPPETAPPQLVLDVCVPSETGAVRTPSRPHQHWREGLRELVSSAILRVFPSRS